MSASNGQIVSYSHSGHKLFVMTNQGSVRAYRAGNLAWSRVMQADNVFLNIVRGDIAPAHVLAEVFETENIDTCCKQIVERGELQYTTAERREMVLEKRREIITYINKNWVNPQTQLPHPVTRIEAAVEKVRLVADPNQQARPQAEELVKKLRGQLMFAKAVAMTAQLSLKHEYVGQLDNAVHHIATVTRTDWTATGCDYTLELSRADMDRLVEALSKTTHGDYDFRTLNEDGMPPPEPEEKSAPRKKKKKKKNRGVAVAADSAPPATDAPPSTDDVSPNTGKRKKRKKKSRRDDSSPADAAPVEAAPVDAATAAPVHEDAEVPSRKRKKKRNRRQNRE